MSRQKYIIGLPVGDFSGDGHEKCDIFYVSSEKPFDAVRDAHFAISERTGIDITSFCNEYGDNEIPAEVVHKLQEMGFPTEQKFMKMDQKYFMENAEQDCPSIMADLWVFLLNRSDPDLHIERTLTDVPMLLFCGQDEKGRFSEGIGYGLFAD